jgi:hypothetical protein
MVIAPWLLQRASGAPVYGDSGKSTGNSPLLAITVRWVDVNTAGIRRGKDKNAVGWLDHP